MALQSGTRLGLYEVVSRIGAGGMGEVWLATELRLNRRIALKLLPADLTRDPARIARFEQEARAASALNHPNVCTIHALGETDEGQHYIAMEYVEGDTLRRRLTTSRLSVRESLDIAIQVAAALSVAHAAGIIHRDIKPENVMLRPDGVVKVLDFGLAKLAPAVPEGADTATQFGVHTDAGTVVGTAAYMSPEQARGQQVDARTDIWSLGVMLYEMVAGRSPFVGPSSTDVLAAILQNEPAPVARFDPNAPAEVQRILTKTLRKDRSQRYQTVQDLFLDLQALHEEIRSQTRSGSAPVTAVTRQPVGMGSGQAATVVPRRTRRVALAGMAAVLVIGAVVAFWAWRTMRSAQTPPVSTGIPVLRNLTRLTFDPGLQTDVTWSPDGTRIAYASDRSGNFDIWTQPLVGGDPVQVTKSPAADTQPSWSPDGQNLVFRSERDGGGLFVVPALGGPERKVSSFGVDPHWSPDGTEILFSGERIRRTSIYLVSSEGGERPREILMDFLRDGRWSWIAFHPDGRISLAGNHRERGFGFFTVSPKDGRVTVSSIAAGFPLRLGTFIQGDRVLRFQWNDAGGALFAEATRNQVRNVWRIEVEPQTLAWQSAERLTTGQGADTAAALSPDGARLAFTTTRESVRLWVFPLDRVAGRVIGRGRPVSPEEGNVTFSQLSPDGRTVAYGLTRSGSDRADLWLTHIDSGVSELFAQNAVGPCWSPDGKMIAYNLFRPDRPPRGEFALAVRELGGAERVLTRWSTDSVLFPQDWAADGRAILMVYLSPLFTGMARLELRSIANPEATATTRVLVEDARARIWQGRYSPDARWVSFVAETTHPAGVQIAVAPARGAARAEWIYIAPDHDAPDKPRWSPDGRTIYFLSRHNSSFFNLWGRRFDLQRGTPVGEPFMVTHFENPGFMIWPDLARGSEIDISSGHVLLTMTTVTGNIWMLDNVDK